MENLGEELKRKMQKENLLPKYNQLIEKIKQDPDVIMFLKQHSHELNQADIERGISKLYEYVKNKENIKNGNEIAMPGYSPDLIVSGHRIEVVYIPTPELQARQKKRELQSRVKSVNMPKSIRIAQIEDYDQDKRQDVLEAALLFIANYESNNQIFHKGMYLEGNFGVGKTFLLAAIANKLAEKGFETTLVHFPSFAVEVKNSIGKNNTSDIVDEIKRAPILMLDDIGADQLSSWLRDDILGVILQYRMQEELPTFFSSNLSMQQLETEYLTINNRGEAEPLKAKRLMERIRFLATEYEITGRNRRLK
ncbi:primosomal protein DnaI [Ligilactobacillus sp. WILCCON 0076]|uniref:Primosomal protein DnaI n=1 Tax=Ligilactobacillus ubinensis TaxID=2876789 RepID=A0A9X2FK93_9LACO|nr:primosomal protein DnaI [Ligilactobacillus ubinensis]MCP0886734.1 primosomal protein DnaI [Ligilactobacillus ubinensis]